MKRFPKNAIIRFLWTKYEALPPRVKLNPFAVLFGLKSAKLRDVWQLDVSIQFLNRANDSPNQESVDIITTYAYRNPIDEPNDRKGILLTLDAAIKELSRSKVLRKRIWKILGEANTTTGTVARGKYGREIRVHIDSGFILPLPSNTKVSLGNNVTFT